MSHLESVIKAGEDFELDVKRRGVEGRYEGLFLAGSVGSRIHAVLSK